MYFRLLHTCARHKHMGQLVQVAYALPGHKGCAGPEEAVCEISGNKTQAPLTAPVARHQGGCARTRQGRQVMQSRVGLTAAISGTGSMTPWGKPGEEQTTSTVLAVRARLTEAGLSL